MYSSTSWCHPWALAKLASQQVSVLWSLLPQQLLTEHVLCQAVCMLDTKLVNVAKDLNVQQYIMVSSLGTGKVFFPASVLWSLLPQQLLTEHVMSIIFASELYLCHNLMPTCICQLTQLPS